MASSIEKLASYLSEYEIVQSQYKDLNNTQLKLLTQKGIFPYEYMNCWAKLEETKLPPKEDFYSTLNDSNITDCEYKHAQNI